MPANIFSDMYLSLFIPGGKQQFDGRHGRSKEMTKMMHERYVGDFDTTRLTFFPLLQFQNFMHGVALKVHEIRELYENF